MEQRQTIHIGSNNPVIKALVFIMAVIVIVYLFPNSKKFKFEYQKGKPWQYEDLHAPFEFSILKSQQEIEDEYNNIRLNFKPFFNVEKGATDRAKRRFKAKLGYKESENTDSIISIRPSRERIDLQTPDNLQHGFALIDRVYKYGLIKEADIIKGQRGSFEITLVDGKFADYVPLSSFIRQAYLKDSLRLWAQAFQPTLGLDVINSIEESIEPNIVYDSETSNQYQTGLQDDVSAAQGMVQRGELIVREDQVVSDMVYQKLESLRMVMEKEMGNNYNVWAVNIGQALVVSLSLILLVMFLFIFRKELIKDDARFTFLFFTITLMVFSCWLILQFEGVSIFLAPFCIVPIIIRAFFDTRVALYTHLISVLIIGFIIPNSFEFEFLQLAAGITALFSIVGLRKRAQLIVATIMIFGVYSIGYTGIHFMHEGDFTGLALEPYEWFAASSALTLFAYPSIYFFEKVFGFTSDVRLLELADTNSPLLKELALKAPGTFQHSLQVANLAEAAIDKIGGNSLLVRVGALYHDIGKMEMPIYFIENQVEGLNPHDSIDFDQSAHIIVSHVSKGIEIARKNRLPLQIIDFIETHHGTTRVQYFYHSYIKKFPDREVDLDLFTYPGPKPFSKETAVLMLADSVEASSRSLKTKDIESINLLVDNIVRARMDEEQFNNSDITMMDIENVKKIFKKMLANMYHARIEYPK